MKDFPQFMKNPLNRIRQASQFTKDIEGYVFDGLDGSQMAFWTCHHDRTSEAHAHAYDEYIVCVGGRYGVIINGETVTLHPGGECFIPAGTVHGGSCIAGTRTIHAFGGKRAERADT
ncbi:MAG: cupin domain-containing protein [Bacillota bacterium]